MPSALILQHKAIAEREGFELLFRQLAAIWRIPFPMLMAKASRETEMGTSRYLGRWTSPITGLTYGGASADRAGRGDGGHGWGLIQVDDRPQSGAHRDFLANFQGTDFPALAFYGAWVARDSFNYFLKKGLRGERLVKAVFAGYNLGPGRVNTADPDRGTTNNYATGAYNYYKQWADVYNDHAIPDSVYLPNGVKNLYPENIEDFVPLAKQFQLQFTQQLAQAVRARDARTSTVRLVSSTRTTPRPTTPTQQSQTGILSTPRYSTPNVWNTNVLGRNYTDTGVPTSTQPQGNGAPPDWLQTIADMIGGYAQAQQPTEQKNDVSLYILGMVTLVGLAMVLRKGI